MVPAAGVGEDELRARHDVVGAVQPHPVAVVRARMQVEVALQLPPTQGLAESVTSGVCRDVTQRC